VSGKFREALLDCEGNVTSIAPTIELPGGLSTCQWNLNMMIVRNLGDEEPFRIRLCRGGADVVLWHVVHHSDLIDGRWEGVPCRPTSTSASQ
jgi:hypothetical protein